MSDGAQVTISSGLQSSWLKASAAVLLGMVGWGLLEIVGIRNDMSAFIAESRAQREATAERLARNDAKDDRQDVDIRELQRDVNTIEGRVMRGSHQLQGGARGN